MWRMELKLYGEQQKLQEQQHLLESYNMMNTVRSPTRITPLHRISNRCYHNIQRYSNIKYSCCRLRLL